ncbi:hypothetical protein Daus18300_009522 [Diaporthe australafricana]|uniref:Uncharacterized protein n=1 Tax=Diaporthe australafricana TaxID=127596 RepID=A0ABR3WDW3_9PEZI
MSEPLSSLARIASIIDLADVAFTRVVEHAQESRILKPYETQAQVYEGGYWIALATEGHRPAEARRLAQDVRQLATSLRDLFKLIQGRDLDGIKDQYYHHSPRMNHVEACRATLVRVAKEFEKPGYDGP